MTDNEPAQPPAGFADILPPLPDPRDYAGIRVGDLHRAANSQMRLDSPIGALCAIGALMAIVIGIAASPRVALLALGMETLGIAAAFLIITITTASHRVREERMVAGARREAANKRVWENLKALLPASEWTLNKKTQNAIHPDHSAIVDIQHEAPEVFERFTLALDQLAMKRSDALQRLGSRDADLVAGIDQQATIAVKALVATARAEAEREARERRRVAEEKAPDIAREFAAEVGRITGASPAISLPMPSPPASLARLVAIGERALAHDRDLTDDAGGRIDDLVRRHLPRLARRHAEAAGAADIGALGAIDAELAAGVEAARASIDEALARDASRRFDDLRTEVAFLRARRGD